MSLSINSRAFARMAGACANIKSEPWEKRLWTFGVNIERTHDKKIVVVATNGIILACEYMDDKSINEPIENVTIKPTKELLKECDKNNNRQLVYSGGVVFIEENGIPVYFPEENLIINEPYENWRMLLYTLVGQQNSDMQKTLGFNGESFRRLSATTVDDFLILPEKYHAGTPVIFRTNLDNWFGLISQRSAKQFDFATVPDWAF